MELTINAVSTLVDLLWMQNYGLFLPLLELLRSLLYAINSRICGLEVHVYHAWLQMFLHWFSIGVLEEVIHLSIHLVAHAVSILGEQVNRVRFSLLGHATVFLLYTWPSLEVERVFVLA